MKNREVTRVASLEIKINRYKKQLEAVVIDLNGMDMFLEHDWLVKYNLKVNWKNETIQFTRCPGSYKMKYQDIELKTRRTQTTEIKEQDNGEIRKEPDKMNLEDLPEYIQSFTDLFNKKKFEKLLEQHKWDYEINLMEEASKELNTKAYKMILKEEEALNQ